MGVQPITIPQSLAYVLNNAGDKSGVDFNYLVQTAQRESSMDPDAKAPSSSAVGLFQFLDTTWLQVMKEEGPRLGYQKYADAITTDANGNYTIKDKALRAKVLALREDPQVAADMAAAFTRSNGAYLQQKFGRMPSPGELYIAHFLGPQGAEKMFDAGLQNPDQIAARLFPEAAKANPQIFYSNGHSRTIREVYKALVAQQEFVQWGAVQAAMEEEARLRAEAMVAEAASALTEEMGLMPSITVRQGDPVAVVRELLAEQPHVAALVLGAAAGGNPGKLVSHFAGADAGQLPCPLMIVPGSLSEEALDRLS